MSSILDYAEQFLLESGFDRAPWLTVMFGGGIAAWLLLPSPVHWQGFLFAVILLGIAAAALWRGGALGEQDGRAMLMRAVTASCLMLALGMAVIWGRSAMLGAEPIAYPQLLRFEASVMERVEQPSEGRIRLMLAMRDPEAGEARLLRVNVPLAEDRPGLSEGAIVRLRARLMPPAPPMLPGAYDFARKAWFEGLWATGSLVGKIEVLQVAPSRASTNSVQRALASHVRASLPGTAGEIAAALSSGDRGGISREDEEAMRDSGLTHLLSISGLHVSALVAAAYFAAMKLLAAFPYLALRLRVPLWAAAFGALIGVGYTILTGAEVPTVRSCIAALLVLVAMAMGREPLSLRMLGVAAFFVLLLWPESLFGPSFQMSFAAVLAIIALHGSGPVMNFLRPREGGVAAFLARRGAMLLLTGLVIEAALMPIVLFHFHRAGVYGAFANMIAIPLVTFATMPLIAVALLLDLVGIGAPAWWLVGLSLDALLAIAHFVAGIPGAVKLMPQMDAAIYALFVVGGLWLGLWHGRRRLWGFVPCVLGLIWLALKPLPDVLITGDGRQIAVIGVGKWENGKVFTLRNTTSEYLNNNLRELTGVSGDSLPLEKARGARCNADYCLLEIGPEADGKSDAAILQAIKKYSGGDGVGDGLADGSRVDRGKPFNGELADGDALPSGGFRSRSDMPTWQLLIARNDYFADIESLTMACAKADIVIAARKLPQSCRPHWLKIDRRLLRKTGGMALYLSGRNDPRFDSVSQHQGKHGWWRGD